MSTSSLVRTPVAKGGTRVVGVNSKADGLRALQLAGSDCEAVSNEDERPPIHRQLLDLICRRPSQSR